MLNEFLLDENPDYLNTYKGLEKYHSIKLEESYFDKDLEKKFIKMSEEVYVEKSRPSLYLATMVGNMYTASLYFSLVSYLIRYYWLLNLISF
jgi:hydroxymethylglutaryl-coA synthase, cytoplasmic